MRINRSFALGALLALPLSSNAAIVTLSGSNVDFTFDNSLLSLFGSPTISGDSLIFSPTTFFANASNAAGLVVTNATMHVAVTPHTGHALDSATLFERGDYYRLEAFGLNTTAVAVLGQFIVDGTNAHAIAPAAPLSTAITSISSPATTTWTSTTTADLAGANAQLTVENILWAISIQLGNGAFIEKKRVEISIGTTPVPIPAPALLLLSALAGTFVVSRRHDKATRIAG